EEWEIARRVTSGQVGKIVPCLSADTVRQIQQLVQRVPVSDHVLGYAWTLVRATRPKTPEALDLVNEWVTWGAGPRGLLALVTSAKARAVLYGRFHASIQDIQAVSKPALRHRLVLSYAAQASGVSADGLIDRLLEQIPTNRVYQPPVA